MKKRTVVFVSWALLAHLVFGQRNQHEWQSFRNGRLVNEPENIAHSLNKFRVPSTVGSDKANEDDVSIEEFEMPSEEINDFFDNLFGDLDLTVNLDSQQEVMKTPSRDISLALDGTDLSDIAYNAKFEQEILGSPLKAFASITPKQEMSASKLNPPRLRANSLIKEIRRNFQQTANISKRGPMQNEVFATDSRSHLLTPFKIPSLGNNFGWIGKQLNASTSRKPSFPILLVSNISGTHNFNRFNERHTVFLAPNKEIRSMKTRSRDIKNGNRHIHQSDFSFSSQNSSQKLSSLKSLPNDVRQIVQVTLNNKFQKQNEHNRPQNRNNFKTANVVNFSFPRDSNAINVLNRHSVAPVPNNMVIPMLVSSGSGQNGHINSNPLIANQNLAPQSAQSQPVFLANDRSPRLRLQMPPFLNRLPTVPDAQRQMRERITINRLIMMPNINNRISGLHIQDTPGIYRQQQLAEEANRQRSLFIRHMQSQRAQIAPTFPVFRRIPPRQRPQIPFLGIRRFVPIPFIPFRRPTPVMNSWRGFVH